MENDKFVCLVEPSKLEFSIISSSANSNEMSGQVLLNSVTSSASDMGAYEGFSPESVMSHTLTLFNPYSYSINFVIACNNPGHYSLKTSKGTIESKCETKIKLRIKPDFLNELVKKVRDINVEEVEQYEDIFQVKYIRSLDKKEAMRAIKSTIKVVFKPWVITTSPPSPPSNTELHIQPPSDYNQKNPIIEITESSEIENSKSNFTKPVIVENHFETSLLNAVNTKQINHFQPSRIQDSTNPQPEQSSSSTQPSTISTPPIPSVNQSSDNKQQLTIEENMESGSSIAESEDFLQLGKNKKKHSPDLYLDIPSNEMEKGKMPKSILKKKSTETLREKTSGEAESFSERVLQLFPVIGGLIILVVFAKFNRVDHDTVVNMVASYLVGLGAMYIQMRFNEQ